MLAALAAQERFSVTELEKFAECSSAWFVERFHNVPGLTTEWFNRFRQDVDDLKARLRAGEK